MFGNLTTNVNPVTGIRYGVASGNNYPDLVDHIMQNGNDLSYDYAVKEIKASFENVNPDDDLATITEDIEGILEDLPCYPKPDVDELVLEVVSPNSDDTQVDRLYDLICDNLQYESDSDNASYELEENGCKYGLNTLGGAFLIWVYESSRIVNVASLCSPCVPNAGDTDSGLTDQDSGYECYGIPADWE
jgi:hypothetical protein